MVGRAGIGVDNIDVAAATGCGVVVMNTPGGNAITTAEHALALLFALARRIPAADASTQAGKWEKTRFMGRELTGKTLGIVGCGNIGAIVADRALGLRMHVLAYDPYLSPERAADLGIEKVDLDRLLGSSDAITLHVPLTDETRGIIDAAALAKTKPGALLINCARGGLVVEEDLKDALASGQVWAGPPSTSSARSRPGTTPLRRRGPGGDAAPRRLDQRGPGQGGGADRPADVGVPDDRRHHQRRQHALPLGRGGQEAEALHEPRRGARLLRRAADPHGPQAVVIEYEGLVAQLNTRPLTQVALTGLLSPILDSVNMVNAPVIARDRNIAVAEVKHDRDCDYQTLMRLTVTSETQERGVAGTLFGGDKPRIVEIKGIPVEAELGPHMLYITNADKPGLIGALGTTLGDAGLNIATFHLGRATPGGEAIALIELDQAIPPAVLADVRQLPHIRQAMPLEF